ncbi:esterase/lipase family protein [Achromobacter kerstersii]|uniref:esterase/lipase family protein n=1 Tax=Achromobacter kerstersii TaxID=1353890 RepID=UPI003D002EB2
MNSPLPDDEVLIPCTRDALGRRVYSTRLTPTEDKREKVLLCSLPAPIPVVFLPGIMGTNLRNRETKAEVWMPPNTGFSIGDIFGLIAAIFTWWSRGPKMRQKLLDPAAVEVDDSGPISLGDSGLSAEAARLRGWGSAHKMYYHPFLARMEQRLDNIYRGRKIQKWWNEEGLREPEEYGEERGQATALSEDELIQAGKYQFDVWCGGYNWLQSNADSAADVRDYIENTVLAHYRKEGGISAKQADTMKVILVTHSMGGIVSRALTELQGYDRVLGVVHGVQPATGAPAIYHHMRCGYEGMVQVILGSNAGEVTAVVGRSPGGLELMPTTEHRGGRPWLFLRSAEGPVLKDAEGRPRAYPQRGDPYEEIYKTNAWYGLVPEQNTKYLNMLEKSKGSEADSNLRADFELLLGDVKKAQHKLNAAGYHPHTYAHYGSDDALHSWREIIWLGDPAHLEMFGANPKDDENGSYQSLFHRQRPKLIPTTSAWSAESLDAHGSGGDGTVPTDSGRMPGRSGIKASFRHGNKGYGEYNKDNGYEHADSYVDDRAQWATLFSVIKIAQLATWHPSHQEQA